MALLNRRLAVAAITRDISEVRWAEAYLRHQLWDLPEQAAITAEYLMRGVLRVFGVLDVTHAEVGAPPVGAAHNAVAQAT